MSGDFVPHPAAVAQHVVFTAQEAAAVLDAGSRMFATNNKTNMLGVQPELVLGAMLAALIAARETGNIVPYLKDMILATNLGPTVARSHVQEYAALHDASMFRQFEIDGREFQAGDDKAGDWVENSNMNATAVRWAGNILYCFANQGSFLGKVAAKTGTILLPPPPPPAPAPGTQPQASRAGLLIEAAALVTPAFRIALNTARPQFAATMRALDEIYGDAGPELDQALTAAALLEGYEI
jgi:hypothetical protein